MVLFGSDPSQQDGLSLCAIFRPFALRIFVPRHMIYFLLSLFLQVGRKRLGDLHPVFSVSISGAEHGKHFKRNASLSSAFYPRGMQSSDFIIHRVKIVFPFGAVDCAVYSVFFLLHIEHNVCRPVSKNTCHSKAPREIHIYYKLINKSASQLQKIVWEHNM